MLKVPGGGAAPHACKAPAGGATTHVVRAGETLSGIASRYGIKAAQIVAANGLTGDRIYVGQQLRLVPAAGSGRDHGHAPTSCAPATRSSTIARRFGTTVARDPGRQRHPRRRPRRRSDAPSRSRPAAPVAAARSAARCRAAPRS